MADDQRSRVADVFDRVSASYDAVGVDFFRPIADGLVAELAPRPGERALDVGCGRGAVLFPLADAVGPTGSVVGVDIAAGMVERTGADVAEAGLAGRVEVLLGDAEAPDLVRAEFDLVASSLVLFFLADPLAALVAWGGLLVPGGRVGVSTFGPFNDEWNAVEEPLRRYVPGAARDPRTNAGGPFGSDEAMVELLTVAGFVDVRTVTTTVPVRFESAEHWYRWSTSIGQLQFWDAVPADEVDAVRATASEAMEAGRRPDGRLGFDQTVRYTLGRRG
jgi:ubiquinone/menaquinone biosynthesis C-methylase UbiE